MKVKGKEIIGDQLYLSWGDVRFLSSVEQARSVILCPLFALFTLQHIPMGMTKRVPAVEKSDDETLSGILPNCFIRLSNFCFCFFNEKMQLLYFFKACYLRKLSNLMLSGQVKACYAEDYCVLLGRWYLM